MLVKNLKLKQSDKMGFYKLALRFCLPSKALFMVACIRIAISPPEVVRRQDG